MPVSMPSVPVVQDPVIDEVSRGAVEQAPEPHEASCLARSYGTAGRPQEVVEARTSMAMRSSGLTWAPGGALTQPP
jgi:hypothetical protein